MNDATDASLLRATEQSLAPAPQSPIPVDRIAELYNGEIFTRETAEAARERIHWMCGEASGGSALDVGCSQGITTVLLAREGVKVTGLDSHPEAMAYARDLSARETPAVQARITWIEGDFWDLPASEQFDTVLLGEVIEHQAAPARFLAKAAQHLAAKGRIVLTTPFGLHPHEDHKVSLFPADLARMARECGLGVAHLDVTDSYMRMVLRSTADGSVEVPAPESLVGLMEKGTLASQRRLFARLDDLADKLRKKTDAAKALQKRLEAAERAPEALAAAAQEHAAELALVRQKHASTNKALTDRVAGLEAEIAALRLSEGKYKQEAGRLKEDHNKELTSLQRASVVELHTAQDRIKQQLTYRWGQVLVAVKAQPLKAITVPWDLYRSFKDFQLQKRQRDGQAPVAGRRVRAGRKGAAAKEERDEPTLRALFWAAQKAGRFEVASDLILEIEALVGDNPPPAVRERLDRLRRSPSNQLRVLKLIEPAAPPRIAPIPGRLCYVLHNSLPYSSGGYGTRSHGVASGLKQAGFDVVVLTRPGFPLDLKPELQPADVADRDEIDGIPYLRTVHPVRSGKNLLEYVTAAADAIETRLREQRPSLVMAASNHVTALPALIAARRLGLPFVYEVRGLWEITRLSRDAAFEQSATFAVQKLLEGSVARHADHVFTLTEPMREELIERGVAPERIDLLPNSCDPERFVPRARDEKLAERLGVPAGVPVIGYIGTFVDYEGLEDLASACAILKQRGVAFRLLLVGNENASGQDRGPITEAISSIAQKGGFADWLIMPGRVPHEEVESYYSLLDVCPFPRKPWPVCEMVSPMKPLEALAMEKAVLVSSVRALVEMIQDGHTGVVFEKGSVRSLADKLQELIEQPDHRLQLGRAGRAWVSAERTWKQIGQKFGQKLGRDAGLPIPGVKAPIPSEKTQPVASAAGSNLPGWWGEIDPSLRSRCSYVDVRDWQLSPAVLELREKYLGRFDPAKVQSRIPAANWARADICVQMVGEATSLLDVGSGLGEFVNLSALGGKQGPVTSVDLKDWDLWFDAAGTIDRVYGSILELDQSHARDVVTCFEVIEHLPPEQVARAVRVLRSLARRKLFISVPFMEPLPLFRGHHTRFDAAKLLDLFPDARFTVFGKGGEKEVRAWILCEIARQG